MLPAGTATKVKVRELLKNRKALLSLTVALVLAIAGCGGAKLTAQQKQGQKIYETLCNKCHPLIDPKAHTDEQWAQAVDKYGAQLQLTEDEKAAVKAYLAVADKQSSQR